MHHRTTHADQICSLSFGMHPVKGVIYSMVRCDVAVTPLADGGDFNIVKHPVASKAPFRPCINIHGHIEMVWDTLDCIPLVVCTHNEPGSQ